MSFNYFVRITHSYEIAERLVHDWAMRCTRLCVYEHEGVKTGKVHIHVLVVGSNIEKKQLRNRGAALGLDLKGNALCSFKVLDVSAPSIMHTLVYCSKGEYLPQYYKEFDYKTELRAAVDAWKEPEEVLTQGQQRYNDFMKEFIPPSPYLEWVQSRGPCLLAESTNDEYKEFVLRVVKPQAQSFSMKKYKIFNQACKAETSMLLQTVYWYKQYQLPQRLERIAF